MIQNIFVAEVSFVTFQRPSTGTTSVGAWFAAPETGDPHPLIAAGLLLLAGPVDRDALADAVQAG